MSTNKWKSYRACSAGIAEWKSGRLPFIIAQRVNWDTANTSPLISITEPFQCLPSFYHKRMFNVLLTMCQTTYLLSPAVRPTSTTMPSLIWEIVAPPTLTQPSKTLWTTIRMIQSQSNKIRWLIIDPHIALDQAMHSASTRFNGITLFTCSVLGVLCVVNWAQGYLLFNPKTNPEFEITSVTNFINTTRWDQASFKYSLQADLSSLYTWNLKQLFVYVECEWVDPKTNITSSSILTDWILQLPEDKANLQKNWTISVQNQRFDYLLRDVYHSLRANTLKFSLKAEYMPIVGFFFKSSQNSDAFVGADVYNARKIYERRCEMIVLLAYNNTPTFFESNISYQYSYYFQIMGQCMEESSSRTREHPLLGPLQQESIGSRLYFKLCLGISSEEQYIEWSKKINKLRYNPELKDYVYTPVRQEFKMTRAACQGSGSLQLLLEPFDQTLDQLLTLNIKNRHYVSESFLGCILLVLSKYIKYHAQKNLQTGPIELQNILLIDHAKMKIIPQEMISNTIFRPAYEIQIDESQNLGTTQERFGTKANPIYITGLICLCFADLIEVNRFYCDKGKIWRQANPTEKENSLKNIEMRYNSLVADLLKEILMEDQSTQITIDELLQKLDVFQCELIAKKQLESMIGLGITMGTPLRTSNIGQTRINNNSNLLKLSALKYDPTDKASTNMQLQQQEDELAKSEAMSIL